MYICQYTQFQRHGRTNSRETRILLRCYATSTAVWCNCLLLPEWIIYYPVPIDRGKGYCFRSISLFISFFLCFFVSKITRKRLDWFAWNFQGRCGVTWFNFGSIQRNHVMRNAQHGDRVCCAFAPQLVIILVLSHCSSMASSLRSSRGMFWWTWIKSRLNKMWYLS